MGAGHACSARRGLQLSPALVHVNYIITTSTHERLQFAAYNKNGAVSYGNAGNASLHTAAAAQSE